MKRVDADVDVELFIQNIITFYNFTETVLDLSTRTDIKDDELILIQVLFPVKYV